MAEKKPRKKKTKAIAEISSDNPDDYPSLIAYYRAKGMTTAVEGCQIQKAKTLYVHHNYRAADIAEEIGVRTSLIQRWIHLYNWIAEKKAVTYAKWEHLLTKEPKNASHINERTDRVLSSLEEIAEQMVEEHVDERNKLAPKDLLTLANAVRVISERRRAIAGVTDKTEPQVHKHEITGGVDILHDLGHAIADLNPKRTALPGARETAEIEDAEFEVLPDE